MVGQDVGSDGSDLRPERESSVQDSRTENAGPGDFHAAASGLRRLDERGPQLVQLRPLWTVLPALERIKDGDDSRQNRSPSVSSGLGEKIKAGGAGADMSSREFTTFLVKTLQDALNSALEQLHRRDQRIDRLRGAIARLRQFGKEQK